MGRARAKEIAFLSSSEHRTLCLPPNPQSPIPNPESRRSVVVHCTCPDEETAARIAHALVEERLAACVQAIPGVVSTYRWQGVVQSESEVLLLIKTTRARLDALKSRLPVLHPYDLPELIVLDAVDGLAPYLHWIGVETSPQ